MAMKKRILKFPPTLRRRMYTDQQIAQALQLLSELNNNQQASEQVGIPRSTLNQWRVRYQTDEEFAERIDQFLADGEDPSSPLADNGPSGETQLARVANH